MCAYPPSPVNLVEKPIHDDKQHHDGEQSGRGLQIESRHILAQRPDDTHRDKPGYQCCAECDGSAGGNRPAMRFFRPGHTRGDRGQDENAFETFSENENGYVEKCDRRTCVRPQRIGRAVLGCSLPKQKGSDGHGQQAEDQWKGRLYKSAVCALSHCPIHAEQFIIVVTPSLPVGCDFLAASCAEIASGGPLCCDLAHKA
jgi:hypothetical protein